MSENGSRASSGNVSVQHNIQVCVLPQNQNIIDKVRYIHCFHKFKLFPWLKELPSSAGNTNEPMRFKIEFSPLLILQICCILFICQAIPWPRRLAAGFPPQRIWFDPS